MSGVCATYRTGRPARLPSDSSNLHRPFDGLVAAQRHLASLAATGGADAAAWAAMQDAMADVFWPQARTAAVPDAAVRRACPPYLPQLRRTAAAGSAAVRARGQNTPATARPARQ